MRDLQKGAPQPRPKGGWAAQAGAPADLLRNRPDIAAAERDYAAAVAAIAFDRPAAVLDGNVERVTARLTAHRTPLPEAKPALRAVAAALTPAARPGCHAQAMMDLGATICTPKSPACGICPWREPCRARAEGIAPDLPAKTPKKPKPVRLGVAYVALSDTGAVALETLLPAALRLYHAELLDLPALFRAMSLNPAKRLGLESGRLARGAPADLVLFDAHVPFVLDRFKLHSKSQNTPFDTQRMQGRVEATYVAGEALKGAL